MAVKLKIIVKDDNYKLVWKDIEYDIFELDRNHPLIKERVQHVIDVFPGDKDDIDVDIKADMVNSSRLPKGRNKPLP